MIEVDSQPDLDLELTKNEKVIALFYATWCPFCTKFVPIFEKKIASYKIASVIHVLLDDYDNPMWDDYEIDAVPTIIFFNKGKILKRLDARLGGGLSEKDLTLWLNQLNKL